MRLARQARPPIFSPSMPRVSQPSWTGHVRMGHLNQLKTADEAFTRIAAIPELAHKPIKSSARTTPELVRTCSGTKRTHIEMAPCTRANTRLAMRGCGTGPDNGSEPRRCAHLGIHDFVGQPWFCRLFDSWLPTAWTSGAHVFRCLTHSARPGSDRRTARRRKSSGTDHVRRRPRRGPMLVCWLRVRMTAEWISASGYQDDDVPGPPG